MKRVFQHPPAPTAGRRYWRSTDELADTPEFREWLEREFPFSAAQLNGDEWSRRSFLKLMGASVALAGFGVSSCRRDRKSTRLNSSHSQISYAVFCLKKKKRTK